MVCDAGVDPGRQGLPIFIFLGRLRDFPGNGIQQAQLGQFSPAFRAAAQMFLDDDLVPGGELAVQVGAEPLADLLMFHASPPSRYAAMACLSFCRARLSRDITVPWGMFMTRAMSL